MRLLLRRSRSHHSLSQHNWIMRQSHNAHHLNLQFLKLHHCGLSILLTFSTCTAPSSTSSRTHSPTAPSTLFISWSTSFSFQPHLNSSPPTSTLTFSTTFPTSLSSQQSHHQRTPQRHRRRSTSPPKSTARQGRADRHRSPRRGPSRRRAPLRREAQSAPPQTAYLTSVAPRRPSHSDTGPVRLTPNKYPDTSKRIPAPPARGALAPLPPPSTPPPDLDTLTSDSPVIPFFHLHVIPRATLTAWPTNPTMTPPFESQPSNSPIELARGIKMGIQRPHSGPHRFRTPDVARLEHCGDIV